MDADTKIAQHLGKKVAAVFPDLTAAFDKLWNEHAIYLLHKLVIEGTMLKWITAYRTTCKIKVRLHGETSEILETVIGCRQGSALSPIFSIAINTLETILNVHDSKNLTDLIQLLLFVDDSVISTTSNSSNFEIK